MAMQSPIDRAFERYQILSRILDRARQRALADPTNEANVELGLTVRGQRREDARSSISDYFEDLGGLVNHVALLDMAAAFEGYFRARLGTSIGEARKVVRERYRSNIPLHAQREGLIRVADEFQGLAEIERLIGGQMSPEIRGVWEIIRKNRNSFAHGTDIRTPPTVTGEQTRETLNEVLGSL